MPRKPTAKDESVPMNMRVIVGDIERVRAERGQKGE